MEKDNRSSLKIVIGSQYFLYFGILGIFLPFFNLYCFHLGFTGFQIGVLSGVRSVALVLFPLLWSALADRFQIRKPIYVFCIWISTGIWGFYLFTADFWVMLIITICYGVFFSPIISFLEAFTMDVLAQEKKSYGRIRVWGSISFILVVSVLGKIIDAYSIEIIVALILAGSVLQALISTGIPDIAIEIKRSPISRVKIFQQRRVLVFLASGFLMLVSHGAYYGFFSIHLEKLGYETTFIGIAWALASLAEVLVMVTSDRIFKRFSLENVLVFSFIVAAARWLTLFFVRSPEAILLSQVFHAATYGTFHMASILYMDVLTPDDVKTMGQAVNNAVTYGLGLMIGFLLSGYGYERMGSSALFMISSVIALAGAVLFKGFQIMNGALKE